MRISILATGGTIDKLYFDKLSEYHVGAPAIAEFLPEANITLDVHVQSILRKDSLDMTDDDRRTIREAAERDPAHHIVITHGTDTMIQTAQALAGVPDKVIVLVGSMTPARFRDTDATFNIGFALAAVQLLPPGAWIAMNGQVFHPDRVRKNRQKHCFEAIDPSTS